MNPESISTGSRAREGLAALDVVAVVRALPGSPKPWLGKRMVSLCATVPWHLQPKGRQARKAKFAARSKGKRKWTAEYKRITLAAGKHHLATAQQLRSWLRAEDVAPNGCLDV